MRTPYTYLITEKETGMRYYGAKYADGCCPADLGVTYFSSSKILEPLCRDDPNNYIYEVRQIFDKGCEEENVDAAIKWEAKFLSKIDAKHRLDWYNQHNGDGKFRLKRQSENARTKISEYQQSVRQAKSEASQGTNNPFFGKNHTKETKDKLSQIGKKYSGIAHPLWGLPRSDETKLKIGIARRGMKHSKQSIAKMTLKHTGKNFNEDHKRKIGEANKGKPRSAEYRRKISESLKARNAALRGTNND
jgi:hypothetical protein